MLGAGDTVLTRPDLSVPLEHQTLRKNTDIIQIFDKTFPSTKKETPGILKA